MASYSDYSQFLLVQWVVEKRYSIVERKQLCDSAVREESDDKLIGKTVTIFWQRRTYEAEILQAGQKIDLNYELNVLTKCEKNKKEKAKQVKPVNVVEPGENIRSVLSAMDNSEVTRENAILQEDIAQLKLILASEKAKSVKLQDENGTLKRKLEQMEDGQVELIDLGNGVLLPKRQLDTIRASSRDAGTLARNLVRVLYKESELVGCSLFGRGSNANKDKPIRPEIEPLRRDAIILYVMRIFSETPDLTDTRGDKTKNLLLKSLHQTMGDYLSYLRRGAKGLTQ